MTLQHKLELMKCNGKKVVSIDFILNHLECVRLRKKEKLALIEGTAEQRVRDTFTAVK